MKLAKSMMAAALTAACGGAAAGELTLGETQFSWSGYVKMDVLVSRFSEAEVRQGVARDTYLPGLIPVVAGDSNPHLVTDMHAKESRLVLQSSSALSDGSVLKSHLEMDFIVAQGTGNELYVNAYNPGLRRYFLSWNGLLAGQDWTTFQNLANVPETLDFIAYPTEGAVVVRQPQLRYSHGGWSMALENGETSLLTPGASPTVTGTGDARLPDLVARWVGQRGTANVMLAGLLRELRVDDDATANSAELRDSALGAGLSLSGKLPVGRDDLRFAVTYGQGIGRYIGFGVTADAIVDDDALQAIPVLASYLAWRHPWSAKWRSTLTLGYFDADNELAVSGDNVTGQVFSQSVNLLYSPVPRLSFGAELRHAQRQLENGDSGELDRLQLSTKYQF